MYLFSHDDFIRFRENQQSTGEGSFSGSTQYSKYHTWLNIIGGRQRGKGNSSTSIFYDVSGAKETISQRVAALIKEIEEMRKIQNEMQVELRSYRYKN
ncbi:hypothetical protein M5K25_021881 [Dendrobium thyrsiflorum]|uniref:Uncharacterized protein n=1 Tax=Dendrobium thyrsiflorum TaxID=117978 RepID=A0ABD0UAZ8_DENTH